MADTTRSDPPSADPIEVVEAFLAALGRLDVDEAATYLADDAVWHNVPFPPARGRATIVRQLSGLRRFGDTEFDVEMHNIAANGAVVLTERTDTLRAGPIGGAFWVCGTFEVHDGRITLWRDRFDFVDVTAGTVAGTVRNLWQRVRAGATSPR